MWRQARRIVRLWLLMVVLLVPAACRSANSPEGANAPPEDSSAVQSAALSVDQALPPARLRIATIDADWPVVAMGWTITESNGDRITRWVVPADEVGWHVNSAGAGAAGNMLLSGHQGVGAAVFAPLALGDVVAGQEVLVEDEAGRVFVYQIEEISDPIPVNNASQAEIEAAAAFTAPSTNPQLTMITGWPDFTTTHRIFARAVLLESQ